MAGLAIALGAVASTASGTTPRYAYWTYTLTGVQVMHWEFTQQFGTIDGSGSCDVTHHGDQTIRFGTGGTIRVRLGTGSATPVEVRQGAKWRGLVPIVGTEQRVHTVVAAPPDLSNCNDKGNAQVAAKPCSVTVPLARGAVEKTWLLVRQRTVDMYDPFAYAFQPRFPACHPNGFDIKQNFWSVLFTRGAELKLRGGSFAARHAKLSGQFKTGAECLSDWPNAGHFVRCSASHNATVDTSWQMTFSR